MCPVSLVMNETRSLKASRALRHPVYNTRQPAHTKASYAKHSHQRPDAPPITWPSPLVREASDPSSDCSALRGARSRDPPHPGSVGCGIPWSIVANASNSRSANAISSPFCLPRHPCRDTVTASFSSPRGGIGSLGRFSSSNMSTYRFRGDSQVGDGLLSHDGRRGVQEILQRVFGRGVLDQVLADLVGKLTSM
jgi:hypothetical protein